MFTGTKKIGGLIEDDEEVYLNLTPMIDVLTCLLFFLLLSFGAIIIALINVTIPALSEGSDQQQADTEKPKKITMTLQINNKAIVVSGDGEVSESELKTFQKTFPITADGYDYQGVNDFLFNIKKRYEESDTAVIVAEPDIPYEILIKVLDATRERVVNMEGKQVRFPMFPAPVISSLVK